MLKIVVGGSQSADFIANLSFFHPSFQHVQRYSNMEGWLFFFFLSSKTALLEGLEVDQYMWGILNAIQK